MGYEGEAPNQQQDVQGLQQNLHRKILQHMQTASCTSATLTIGIALQN
jgi:hypothetical protein